jgi:DNA-binding GntR family transcriptional regulator
MYATLLPGERELLHARLAQALSDEPQLGGGGAAELAHHWAAAERPVEALGASLLAAREAEAVSGLSEALGHVERVLELWDEVPGAEQLAGVGLPSVLAWAIDLADASAPADGGVDAGAILTALAPAEELSIDTLAGRLALSARAARAGLRMLEREGLVERVGQSVRAAPLAIAEASRLYPLAVVLESLAVRISPRFEPDDITALREANTQLLMARNSPAAAVAADDHLHRLLTRRCGNAHLLTALGPVKRALLRYERVFMLEPEHVDRAVAGHEPIIAALERGDHPQAAQLVRGNLTYGLDDLRDALER